MRAGLVTWRWFHVFGAEPIAGRTFLPEEDQKGANQEVVLSYSMWQRTLWRPKRRDWQIVTPGRQVIPGDWRDAQRFRLATQQPTVDSDGAGACSLRCWESFQRGL